MFKISLLWLFSGHFNALSYIHFSFSTNIWGTDDILEWYPFIILYCLFLTNHWSKFAENTFKRIGIRHSTNVTVLFLFIFLVFLYFSKDVNYFFEKKIDSHFSLSCRQSTQTSQWTFAVQLFRTLFLSNLIKSSIRETSNND